MTEPTDPTALDGGPLGLALQERVRDEWLDLDELVRTSTRIGTRIRRRRRAGVALAAAGGVAAVAVGVALLGSSGDPSGPSHSEPQVATDPSASQSSEVDQQELQRLAREARAHARAVQMLQDAPVYVASPDWRCDRPLDEKFTCTRGAATVTVNWRPAETWADYQDPGKADVLDDVHTFVSEVHGDFFATVAPVPGTTQAQVDEVGAALIWAE